MRLPFMTVRRRPRTSAIVALLAATAAPAMAAPREIMISANDGKPVRPGDTAASQVEDTLSVLELTRDGVRTIGSVAVPASMTGPPESVKLTPDRRYAIVTSAQRNNDAPMPLLVPGDAVSVVDLTDPARPQVVQRLAAGAGAVGVAIDPKGKLVLVANGSADTVSVFALAGGRLAPVDTVSLPAGSKPVAARFTSNGRSAIVVGASAGKVFRLAITGTRVAATGESLATGRLPSSLSLSPDGRTAYVANVEGNAAVAGGPTAEGIVAVIDTDRFRLVGTAPLGNLPEHVAVSPSGRYLQATLVNGSHLSTGAPGYHATGLLRVFSVRGVTILPLAEIATPPLCQGAAWSRDERRILLQCAGPRTIAAYRLDGRALTLDPAQPIATVGRPGAITGAFAR